MTQTAGDVIKAENMIVEVFTVKASQDIELGEVVTCTSSAGLLAAATGHKGPYFMAMDSHTYATSASAPATQLGADHQVRCLMAGMGITQAMPAVYIYPGCYVEIAASGYDGEVTVSDLTAWYDAVGIGMELVGTAGATTVTTTCRVLFGHNG